MATIKLKRKTTAIRHKASLALWHHLHRTARSRRYLERTALLGSAFWYFAPGGPDNTLINQQGSTVYVSPIYR